MRFGLICWDVPTIVCVLKAAGPPVIVNDPVNFEPALLFCGPKFYKVIACIAIILFSSELETPVVAGTC